MKIRIPTLSDVLSLFVAPTTVAGALADLHRAADRARVVIDHNRAQAAAAEARRASLVEAALLEANAVDAHTAEADRADRVSTRLAELLA
jgi:hypothetical protein